MILDGVIVSNGVNYFDEVQFLNDRNDLWFTYIFTLKKTDLNFQIFCDVWINFRKMFDSTQYCVWFRSIYLNYSQYRLESALSRVESNILWKLIQTSQNIWIWGLFFFQCACICPPLNVQVKRTIIKNASIFTAECLVVVDAMDVVKQNEGFDFIVLFRQSKGAIELKVNSYKRQNQQIHSGH